MQKSQTYLFVDVITGNSKPAYFPTVVLKYPLLQSDLPLLVWAIDVNTTKKKGCR